MNQPSNSIGKKLRLEHLDTDSDGLADTADVSPLLPCHNVVDCIAGQKIALRKAEAGDGIPIRCHQVRRLLKELHLYPTAGLTPVVEPQFVVAAVDCGNCKTPFQRCNQTAEAVRLPTCPPDLQRTMSAGNIASTLSSSVTLWSFELPV